MQLCGILGWIGAFSSAGFLILIYWNEIQTLTQEFIIAAATVPAVGFCLAYTLARVSCQVR